MRTAVIVFVPTKTIRRIVLQDGRSLSDLSVLCGWEESTLCKALKLYKTMKFETADRILCVIDRVDAWHTEPELAKIYEISFAEGLRVDASDGAASAEAVKIGAGRAR
jgi:hypothetical protein